MIHANFKKAIEKKYFEKFNTELIVNETCPVSGGCINNTAMLKTSAGLFFVKWNDAQKYPGMFDSEMKGLLLLYEAQRIRIPKPLFTGTFDDQSFIFMEFVQGATQIKNFWEDFGASLALLHKNTNADFGLNHDNFIGSLTQSNKQHKTWTEFFIDQRLEKQTALAFDNNLMNTSLLKNFEGLYKRLPDIFPEEPPALLHGDLWNGNYIVGAEGKACIIDPAVYYGHREMDLAMTKLFGGFAAEFYSSYHNTYSLEKGWESRIEICNLYPLLVHLNLFGRSYLSGIEYVVRRF